MASGVTVVAVLGAKVTLAGFGATSMAPAGGIACPVATGPRFVPPIGASPSAPGNIWSLR